MRFFSVALTVLSVVAGYVSAQVAGGPNPINYPSKDDTVPAGTSITIKWTPSNQATITLTLRYGSTGNLAEGAVIASNIPNSGSYAWSVPANIGSGSWTLEIKDSTGGVNYSPMFQVTGGTGTQGATGTATTRTASATGSSSSATTTTSSGSSSSKASSTTSTSSSSGSSSSSRASTSSSRTSSPTGAPSAAAAVKFGAGGGFAAAIGFGALVAMA